jgi:hypothetical protein
MCSLVYTLKTLMVRLYEYHIEWMKDADDIL